jgi:hypothetical protein
MLQRRGRSTLNPKCRPLGRRAHASSDRRCSSRLSCAAAAALEVGLEVVLNKPQSRYKALSYESSAERAHR